MITYERLHELLNYDSETGRFTWKVSRGNKVNVGAIAGWNEARGYLQIGIGKKLYYGHRLAWLYFYGYTPEHGLDHINQNKADNRISNLREVSVACNLKNRGLPCNNTSGVKGVVWYKRDKKWQAGIKINQKNIYLGRFVTKLDAAISRFEAEKKYNWSDCDMKKTSAAIYIEEYHG